MLRVSVIALWLLCWALPAFAQSQQPSLGLGKGESNPLQTPSDSNGRKTAADQRGTDTSPFVVKLANTGKSDAESAKETLAQQDQATTNRWLVGLTAALAGSSFLLFGVGMYQAYLSDRTATRQLRAYVYVETAHLEDMGVGRAPIAHIGIKNFGQTPAYCMTNWARVGFDFFPLKAGEPPRLTSEELSERPFPPGGTLTMQPRFSVKLTADHIEQLRKGEHAIYVVGEIRYRDIFGKKCSTDFFLFATKEIATGAALASYKDGNRAD